MLTNYGQAISFYEYNSDCAYCYYFLACLAILV